MVTLNTNDLAHILEQIRVAEDHARLIAQGMDPQAALSTLVSSPLIPYGLRTVSGELNNFTVNYVNSGSADQIMQRLLQPVYKAAEMGTTYADTTGARPVMDSQPRLISNLVADQTLNNVAAISAALSINGVTGAANLTAAVEIHNAYKAALGTVDGQPTEVETAAALQNPTLQAKLAEHGIQMDGVNVFLGNVAADLGDTAPYNSFFTIFGQFFDHGLDLTGKGGNGVVIIPLSPDDPLFNPTLGSRGNFMILTRATNVEIDPGADGIVGTADDIRGNNNETTPWIDLNQVYTSNPSHQVFLREYAMVDGKPVPTGRMLESATGGPPTWADIKEQAREMLGIELTDMNVLQVPALVTDLYGNFIPGPNGFPQLVSPTGEFIEGVLPTEPGLPAGVSGAEAMGAGRAFLNDIAHSAAPNLAGTYDAALLGRHFIVGDGRGNENIALTAIHSIFKSEHNHQVEAVKLTMLDAADRGLLQEYVVGQQTPADLDGIVSQYAALKAALDAATTPEATTAAQADLDDFVDSIAWDGARLFQTARFSTEMVYQHLVFEEFVRAIAPQIDPFVFSNTVEIPVGISQEFAQVVYRFGHSMLNETVDMFGANNELGLTQQELFDAFLNPDMFNAQGVDADAAAGAILRGMTRQHGNEIDEFLTTALRNNLVGLPLDLAALNIARARDTGIPSLNEARSQFFDQTQNSYVKPYTSWTDFAANLKNPASVINFIAAYGTHPAFAATVAVEVSAFFPTGQRPLNAEERRDIALKLVLGDPLLTGDAAAAFNADRLAFLNATGPYAGGALGGLNNVDFWIGGLAEAKMPFGGMLGSTFTFVFEAQMEALQNGDRFYYLSRTQGMNLLTQLESDSFADLIRRNTDTGDSGYAINGAAFQTADWVLQVDQSKQWNTGIGSLDPTREADVLSSMTGTTSLVERLDLDADGDIDQIKYLGGEHVVIGGTAERDIIIGGAGDDGLWGEGGDDDIEGGYGVDHIHGGAGSDLITDSGTDIGAADVLKGEGGDDLINGGMGLDLVFGGDGRDVLAGGSEAKDVFGGQGDDFIRAASGGGGIYYGNEGNDWLEGQGNMNTLTGDNSELFFNSRIIGHDVMLAGENDTDFDAESGDDIMTAGVGINRFNGMAGFDWVTHKGSDYNVDADMNISIFVNQQNNILRDRFDLVEGLSGWDGDDKLTGREVVVGAYDPDFNAAQPGRTSPIASYSNALLESNIDMVDGLRELVAHLATFELTQPVTNEVVTARMNTSDGSDILLGGGGSDLIRGMAGNDIIDGDKWLNVRIEVKNDAGQVIGSSDGLTKQIIDPNGVALFGGKTLEQALFAREVKAANLNVVREILDGDAANADVDTAVYWDSRENYTLNVLGNGVFELTHDNQLAGPVDPTTGRAYRNEGTDRLTNVEVLQFGDGSTIYIGNIAAEGQPLINDTTPTIGGTLRANPNPIIDQNGLNGATMSYQWQALVGGTWTNIDGATARNFQLTAAQVGLELRVAVSFVDAMGYAETVYSATTAPVGDIIEGTIGADTLTGTAGADRINGQGGADVIFGGTGADTINGGAGADVIDAGAGDDLITVNALQGRDIINGGDNDLVGDTVQITASAAAETFTIYTADAYNSVRPLGAPALQGNTEIVITRTVTSVAGVSSTTVIAELDGIEELLISTLNVSANDGTLPTLPNGGTVGNDRVDIVGDFTTTSLNYSTITIDGDAGDDTVDISGLQSAHRIVFRTRGGNDVVVGTLRAQDVIELPAGVNPADYVAEDNGDGTVTMSNAGHTVTFAGSVTDLPTLVAEPLPDTGTGGDTGTDAGTDTGTDAGTGTGGDTGAGGGTGGNAGGDDNGTDNGGDTNTGGGGEGENENPGDDNGTDNGTDNNGGGGGESENEDGESEGEDNSNGSGTGAGDGTGAGNGTGSGVGTGGGSGGGSVVPPVPTVVDGVVLMPGSTAGVQVGDAGDDVIVGGEQGDALLGKGGHDIMLGNGGNDVGLGGSGADTIEGGAGRDVLLGGDGDDVIIGQSGDGADMIFGGAGSDTLDLSALTEGSVIDLGAYTAIGTVRTAGVTDHLIGVENAIGGTGADVIKASLSINVLTGGDGDDVFVFVSAGTADGDVITDFRPGDRIDLSGIDAMVGTNGNQAFTLAEAGTTAAGSLVIREVATEHGVDTIIDGFTDADADADFSITLRGAHNLDTSSFNF